MNTTDIVSIDNELTQNEQNTNVLNTLLSPGIDLNELISTLYPELRIKKVKRYINSVKRVYTDNTEEDMVSIKIQVLNSVEAATKSHVLRYRETQIPANTCPSSNYAGNICHLLINGYYFSRNNIVVEIYCASEDDSYNTFLIAQAIDRKIMDTLTDQQQFNSIAGIMSEDGEKSRIERIVQRGSAVILSLKDIAPDGNYYNPTNDEIIENIGAIDYKENGTILFYPLPDGIARADESYDIDLKILDDRDLTIVIPIRIIVKE